jgi:DNA-directed RNA polymerase I subunit RPA2
MTQAFAPSIDGGRNICVQLDGKVIGWASPAIASQLASNLRIWKTEGLLDVPLDLEIGFVPESKGGQYPGVFLFSTRARMMRPVKYLANGRDDQVGPFEQVYMDIACTPEEIEPGVSTHVEHDPSNFLSILASLTPFSDFNQVGASWRCMTRFSDFWPSLHEISTNARHAPSAFLLFVLIH